MALPELLVPPQSVHAGGKRVLVVHGPNLNLLGTREPHLYGQDSLADIDARLVAQGSARGASVHTFQSNHEGALVDRLQAARGQYDWIIINAASLTHTSVALRDALLACEVPTIEVHISNVFRREPFRHTSFLSDVAEGSIIGLGPCVYDLALDAALRLPSRVTGP